jgi:ABC-type multidrug transport system ATPase subunit
MPVCLPACRTRSLGIPAGECFGLLGINGAGKTTTLSMLSAEFPPTRGSIAIAGHDIIRTPAAVKRLIGFCPQFDAIFDLLTGEEHLRMCVQYCDGHVFSGLLVAY